MAQDAYEVGKSEGWSWGPSMPYGHEHSAMVEVDDGVVVVGGQTDDGSRSLYRLTQSIGRWCRRFNTFFVADATAELGEGSQ